MQRKNKGRPKTAKQIQKEICATCRDHGICIAETGKPNYYCVRGVMDELDKRQR